MKKIKNISGLETRGIKKSNAPYSAAQKTSKRKKNDQLRLFFILTLAGLVTLTSEAWCLNLGQEEKNQLLSFAAQYYENDQYASALKLYEKWLAAEQKNHQGEKSALVYYNAATTAYELYAKDRREKLLLAQATFYYSKALTYPSTYPSAYPPLTDLIKNKLRALQHKEKLPAFPLALFKGQNNKAYPALLTSSFSRAIFLLLGSLCFLFICLALVLRQLAKRRPEKTERRFLLSSHCYSPLLWCSLGAYLLFMVGTVTFKATSSAHLRYVVVKKKAAAVRAAPASSAQILTSLPAGTLLRALSRRAEFIAVELEAASGYTDREGQTGFIRSKQLFY